MHVSIVTIVFSGSTEAEGTSDISIGTNSGTDDVGINDGKGGAENGSSSVDLDFRAGRSAGCRTGTGGAGGVREGRGGDFDGLDPSICCSFAGGSGRGGSGGLVGGEGGTSTVAAGI